MSRYQLHTRSFHPGVTFGDSGLQFSGDNRGFSLSRRVTSRIRHQAIIDFPGARVIHTRPASDPSHHNFTGVTQTYTDPGLQPDGTTVGTLTPYTQTGDQRFEVRVQYRGKNYAFPGVDWEKQYDIGNTGHRLSISPRHGVRRTVPDLDVTNTVSGHVDRTSRKLHVTCDLRGDGFPNCETFLVDQKGGALFLCSHIRVGVALFQLAGNRRIAMGRAMLEVDINEDLSFGSNVKCYQALDYASAGAAVDLRPPNALNLDRIGWNRVHLNRKAIGAERRREQDNEFWDGFKERWFRSASE
jgi:hypothetical protein